MSQIERLADAARAKPPVPPSPVARLVDRASKRRRRRRLLTLSLASVGVLGAGVFVALFANPGTSDVSEVVVAAESSDSGRPAGDRDDGSDGAAGSPQNNAVASGAGAVDTARHSLPEALLGEFSRLQESPGDVVTLPYESVREVTPGTEFVVDGQGGFYGSDLLVHGVISAVLPGDSYSWPNGPQVVGGPSTEVQHEFNSSDSDVTTVDVEITVDDFRSVDEQSPGSIVLVKILLFGVIDFDAIADELLGLEVLLLVEHDVEAGDFVLDNMGQFFGVVDEEGQVRFAASLLDRDESGAPEAIPVADLLEPALTRIDVATVDGRLTRLDRDPSGAVAAPRISVNGAGQRLEDGIALTATAENFDEGSQVVFVLCSNAVVTEPQEKNCDMSTSVVITADSTGGASTVFSLGSGIETASETVDCVIVGCVLVAVNPAEFSQAAGWPFRLDGLDTLPD